MPDRDQNQKRDAGKARFDLLPWHDFQAIAIDHSVGAVAQALTMWWAGKPHTLDMSIPARQLRGVAAVLAFGAAKYAPRGWERGIPYSRVFAAAMRHAAAYEAGELLDEESGLPHESHFWCNVLFLVVFAARGRTDLDDRPDPVASVLEYFDGLKAQLEALAALAGVERAPEPPAREGMN